MKQNRIIERKNAHCASSTTWQAWSKRGEENLEKISEKSRKIGSRAGRVGACRVTVPWRAAARAPSPQPPRVLLCLHKPHIQLPPSRAPARVPCHSVSVFLFIIISQGIIKEHYPQANAPLPNGSPSFHTRAENFIHFHTLSPAQSTHHQTYSARHPLLPFHIPNRQPYPAHHRGKLHHLPPPLLHLHARSPRQLRLGRHPPQLPLGRRQPPATMP